MTLIIRTEDNKDYRQVEEVAREAFWNLYFPGCHEHYVVHKMRSHPDFIKELATVIELDGNIIGAMFYTHAKIKDKEQEVSVIAFGPVFIHPNYHRQGYGRKMIEASIKKAREMGYRAILTLGYPYHYETYGFKGGKHYNISMPDGLYYKGLLVLPLYKDALKGIKGKIYFSEALEVTEEEVEAYDKTFYHKEKGFQESQIEFENTVSLLDE